MTHPIGSDVPGQLIAAQLSQAAYTPLSVYRQVNASGGNPAAPGNGYPSLPDGWSE